MLRYVVYFLPNKAKLDFKLHLRVSIMKYYKFTAHGSERRMILSKEEF